MSTLPTLPSLEETAELYKSTYHLPPQNDEYSQSVYLSTLIHSQYPNVPKRTFVLPQTTPQQPTIASTILNTNITTTSLEAQIANTHHQAPSTAIVEASVSKLNAVHPTNVAVSNQNANFKIDHSAHASTGMPKYRLMRVIKAHDNWVTTVNVDVANRLFATGSIDQTVKIWNLETGEQLYTFTGHLLSVNCVRFSPNHPRLYSCATDRELRAWDLESNSYIGRFHGHKRPVNTIEIHPTLDLVMTGGADNKIILWDMRTRTQVRCLEGHRAGVTSLVGLPTDPQLISGSLDISIRLWDIGSGKTISTHTYHSKSIRKLVSPAQIFGSLAQNGQFDNDNIEYTMLSASSDSIKKWRLPILSSIDHVEANQSWGTTQKELFQLHPHLAERNVNAITGKQAPLKPLQEPATTSTLTLMHSGFTGGLPVQTHSKPSTSQGQTTAPTKTPPQQNSLVHSLAINQSGVVVSGRADGVVDFYNYVDGKCYDSILTPPITGSLESEAAVLDIAFDMTGTSFLTSCADKSVKMYVMQ